MSANAEHQDRQQHVTAYLLPVSLFAIAASITYFTWQLGQVSQQIPDILVRIDNTTEKVSPVVDDVTRAIDLVPDILDEVEAVRHAIPPILDEVKAVRTDVVPSIVEQVDQTNRQIPAILNESRAIREETQALRGELPAVLKTADKAVATIDDTNKQIAASLPRVDRALDEAETTRKQVPGWMDRADQMIEKARVAGKEASQGAVTGFFSGIIMAPFALVASAGESLGFSREELKEMNETDLKLTGDAALLLLNQGSEGEERSWQNPDNNHNGKVVLKDIYQKGEFAEFECRAMYFSFSKGKKLIKDKEKAFCKNDDGAWEPDTEN